MSEWKKVRLGDIAETNNNTYSISEKWDFVNYLDTGNLTRDEVDEYQQIIIGKDKLPSRARRKVKLNDILYSTVRPNQLHYGIVKNIVPNMLVSTGFAVVSVDETKADSEFVYYFLTQNEVTETLHAIGEQSTSAYPSIKPSDIENLEILLPPLEDQKEIARTLRVLDDKIENNKKINHHLAQLASILFSTVSQTNSIPLGQLFNCKSGYAFKSKDWSDNGQPVIKIKDIDGVTIQTDSLDFINNSEQLLKAERYKVCGGELVIALTGATTGKIGVIPSQFTAYINQRVGLFYPQKEMSFAILWAILLQNNIITDLVELASGSAQANLSPNLINKYEITADISELTALDMTLAPIYEKYCNNLSEIDELTSLRNTLLPKLLSGKITLAD